ncbi:hypothetical protein [Flavobacterium sp. LHD-85]|uniref:hypothetical protein n=2 Tax=unclassified Flavobacterium TaxID=196869 RepID=UPI0027E1BBDA|nr:hypothetical protein [Flavobacterium sp. LHD-85]MDQ6532155.1 hypothetical protein [Flavobacterium sp. LHD-85]
MDYAKDNNFGKSAAARAKKTKRASRTAQRVCVLDAETQRCGRGAERQTKGSACGGASDGFLKVSFLPKLQRDKTVQACGEIPKMQEVFFASLAQLSEHYSIEPMQTGQFEYPYKTALALWDIGEKLKKSVLNCPEIRLLKDGKKTYFISEEKHSTGTTLYYIPIQPLYQMLHDPRHKKNAQLLVSVCSYLYHVADIPYFRQENSYLHWMYEMHRDWTEQDDETEGFQKDLGEFDKAKFIGDRIEQKIFNRINLAVFQKRLNAFKSRDAFDRECVLTARKAFDLYSEYPNESIFRNAPIREEDTDESENETIGMEKYISFIYDTKGWLYESIAESINSEFNEYGAMDEPTIIKCFNGVDAPAVSLDFENRLFALLDDMCQILYNYKTTADEYGN